MILFAFLMGLFIGGLVALSWRSLQDIPAVSVLPWFDGDSELDEMLNEVIDDRRNQLYSLLGRGQMGYRGRVRLVHEIINTEIDEFVEQHR